jgi:hypothetical protein
MFKFGKQSLERLGTCDIFLQRVAQTAIQTCPIDFGIAEGHRSLEDQMKYFKEGKSQVDGVIKKSNHCAEPSRAFDFYCWINGKVDYSQAAMSFVAAWILCTGKNMGINNLRWGGNWNGDGEIITGQTLVDAPHIELTYV